MHPCSSNPLPPQPKQGLARGGPAAAAAAPPIARAPLVPGSAGRGRQRRRPCCWGSLGRAVTSPLPRPAPIPPQTRPGISWQATCVPRSLDRQLLPRPSWPGLAPPSPPLLAPTFPLVSRAGRGSAPSPRRRRPPPRNVPTRGLSCHQPGCTRRSRRTSDPIGRAIGGSGSDWCRRFRPSFPFPAPSAALLDRVFWCVFPSSLCFGCSPPPEGREQRGRRGWRRLLLLRAPLSHRCCCCRHRRRRLREP